MLPDISPQSRVRVYNGSSDLNLHRCDKAYDRENGYDRGDVSIADSVECSCN